MDERQTTKVLVTGARGFLGSNICQKLLRQGAEVHALSRTPPVIEGETQYSAKSGRAKDNGSKLHWWCADLAEPEAARRLLLATRPALVFHLASLVTGSRQQETVLPTLENNFLTTLHLLNAATEIGTGRLVLAGSLEEPNPSDPQSFPCSPYAAAKSASAAYARMFHALYNTPSVVARIAMVYGPGQLDMAKLVPYVIQCLLRGERPRLSSGRRLVDWVYIDDVANGLLAAAQAPALEGRSIDLGSGELNAIRDVVQELVCIMDSKIEPEYGALPDRPLEQERIANVAESSRLIGWVPTTTLNEGLKRTVAWYTDRFHL